MGILRGRRSFYLTKISSYCIPFCRKTGFELKNCEKIIDFIKYEFFSKWVILTEDRFNWQFMSLYHLIYEELNSKEDFWLIHCHFGKMIFENPKIYETWGGKLICRALSLYRRDLNYLSVSTGGLKLSVGKKKFWKNNQKIGEIHLGKFDKKVRKSRKFGQNPKKIENLKIKSSGPKIVFLTLGTQKSG